MRRRRKLGRPIVMDNDAIIERLRALLVEGGILGVMHSDVTDTMRNYIKASITKYILNEWKELGAVQYFIKPNKNGNDRQIWRATIKLPEVNLKSTLRDIYGTVLHLTDEAVLFLNSKDESDDDAEWFPLSVVELEESDYVGGDKITVPQSWLDKKEIDW